MHRYVILGSFFVIVVALLYWAMDTDVVITNYPSSGENVVAFGDSLLAGVGASEGNALPDQIAKHINEPIINLGVSGDTTAMALARIEAVATVHPKVVIISLGGNDLIGNVPREQIRANLEQIIIDLQAEGAIVVLLGVRGPFKNIDDIYDEVSKKYGTAYVDNILDGLIGRSAYMYDAVHPNDLGYEKIAERVAPVVQKLITP